MNNSEFQTQTELINRLVQRVSELKDDDARTTALELLQSLMDLHGAVTSRIVELLSSTGETGKKSLALLGKDPMICGLMVLYGVHPVALEERVGSAIEKVRAQLLKQGGSVNLLSIAESVVRVKIEASGHGCGSSPDAFKKLVEQAILEAAPEIVEVVAEAALAPSVGFVPLNMIRPVSKEETKYEESTA